MQHTNWYKDAIIYQIYPRSFKDTNNDGLGDIPGIISKLDYLKKLGITAIWLSPVYDSPQFDNGYDIADYKNIWKPFGTMSDMKELIAQAHQRDIKIIMDLVVNHTSSEHAWFKSALSSKDSPYRDYYIIKKGKRNGTLPPTKWVSFFGGSAWEKIEGSDEYFLHLFAKEQPDLNWENPKVRQEVIDVLNFWMSLGVDGFRCDVITLLSKDQRFKNGAPSIALRGKKYYISGPRLHEYLHLLYEKAYSNYDVMTVGETVMGTDSELLKLVNPKNQELDMVFNFAHTDSDNYFGVKYFYRKFKLTRFKNRLAFYQNFLKDGKGWNTLFIENHDQRRSTGRFGTDINKYRIESAKSLATSYFLLQGTPFIYQGQELGMQNMDYESIEDFRDIETLNTYKTAQTNSFYKNFMLKHLYEVSRDNARTPMQWDDTEFAGFSSVKPWLKINKNKSFINAKNSLEDRNSIFYYYQKLIEIRKAYSIVKNGNFKLLHKRNKNLFIYERILENKRLLVVCSFANHEVKNPIKDDLSKYKLLLSNCENNSNKMFSPYEARVYYKE